MSQADAFDEEDLKLTALAVIHDNASQVLASEEILLLSHKCLSQVIKSDHLGCEVDKLTQISKNVISTGWSH